MSAKLARVGFGGWTLAMGVGSALGICSGAALYYGLRVLSEYAERKPQPEQDRYLLAIYLAVIPWMVVAGLLGRWTSYAVLRLIT